MSDRHFTLEELSAYLDGELDLDDKQQAHLKTCPECTKVFEGQRTLRRLARDASPPVPTDEMWSAIKDQIGEEIKRQIAESGGRKHDGRTAKGQKSKSSRNGGFRWGPGLWLGLSSALAAAGVLLIIRPSVEPSQEFPAPAPVPEQARKPAPPPVAEPAKAPAPANDQSGGAVASSAGAGSRGDSLPRKNRAPVRRTAKRSLSESRKTDSVRRADQPVMASATRVAASEVAASTEPDRSIEVASAPEAPMVAEPKPVRQASRPSAAPAAAPATAGLGAPAPARPVYAAKTFFVTADRIITSDPALISASGRVIVRPSIPGAPYVATVDGLTRSVTGELTGVMAEIVNPGQRLILHTRPGMHSEPAAPTEPAVK